MKNSFFLLVLDFSSSVYLNRPCLQVLTFLHRFVKSQWCSCHKVDISRNELRLCVLGDPTGGKSNGHTQLLHNIMS